jgi:hypothetical protein
MELAKQIQSVWHDVTVGEETLGFLLHPLTAAQKLSLMAMADGPTGEAMMQTVRYGVRDWHGITKNGEPAPFSQVALEILFRDGEMANTLLELALVIGSRAEITEDDQKK